MGKTVTYGIIGFGGIAENRTAKEGFAMDKERFPAGVGDLFCLLGVTDPNQARKAAAESYGLEWFASADEMLADARIDAVYVAAPNSLHAAIAKQAMEAGKHVLLEKPMTTSVVETIELSKIAAERGLSLSCNLMMTKNGLNIAARDRIAAGALGQIDHVITHMEFLYGSTPEEAATWRCSRPEEMGGPIGDVASHCMYMGEFLLGDTIAKLRCTYTPKTLPLTVENGAVVHYETAGGKTGSCRVAFNLSQGSLAGTLSGLGFDVYGEKGILSGLGTMFQLSGHADEPYRIRLVTDNGEERSVEFAEDHPFDNIYQAQIREHAESILNGAPLDGSEGLHNLKLVSACYESAENGGKEIVLL